MSLENQKRDDNYIPTPFVDMSTGLLPTKIYVDETTHRLLVNAVITSPTLATESTLAKTVGFDANSDLTITTVTVGSVITETQTDGTKTLTIVTDITDANNITETRTWS
jgi:hypothetical protein